MSLKFRKSNIKLRWGLINALDPYLEEDEEIIDVIRETIVPDFDFRWLILTNLRVVLVIYRWFAYDFHDVRFEGIDMQLKKGPFFDQLHIKSLTDDYSASFYTFNRSRTEEFLAELEKERNRFYYEKTKLEKETEHEAVEELVEEGEIPPEQDEGHEEELEKEIKGKEQEVKKTGNGCPPVKTLKELNNLKKQGIITDDEYQEKKRELLKRI